MTLPRLFLKPGREKSLLRRHPWIFSGSVERIEGDVEPGAELLVADAEGKALAVAGYSPASQIAARVWSFDPDETIDAGFFRRRIASVFQESLLITGTIRDNITLKDDGYTDAELRRALELSGADALVARLPEGLEHRIGFDGGGLSGGERQKLAIARALIRRPDILIFDEVTNHLDYESRLKMRDMLTRLRGKCTVLLVSHDPELIKLCDRELHLAMEK